MEAMAQVIQFPGVRQQPAVSRPRTIRNMDGIKYFSEEQIRLLRRTVRDQALVDEGKGQVTAIREWMAIDLITSSGLRVSEAADVRCGDIRADYGESALYVRDGKGARSRTVQIPDALKLHLKRFVIWKAERGETLMIYLQPRSIR